MDKYFSKTKFLEAINILGASLEDNFDSIKKKYRKLAMINHPDRNGDQEKFKKIQTSFDYVEHWHSKINIHDLNKQYEKDDNNIEDEEEDYDYYKYKYNDKYSESDLNFVFRPSGKVFEICEDFITSYIKNYEKIINNNYKLSDIQLMADKYLEFLTTYSMNLDQIGFFKLQFLQKIWQSNKVEYINLSNNIFYQAKEKNKKYKDEAIEGLFPFVIFLKPKFSTTGFSPLDILLTLGKKTNCDLLPMLKRLVPDISLFNQESSEFYKIIQKKSYIEQILEHEESDFILNILAENNMFDLKSNHLKSINFISKIFENHIKILPALKSKILEQLDIEQILAMINSEDNKFSKQDKLYLVENFENELIKNNKIDIIPTEFVSEKIKTIFFFKENYEMLKKKLNFDFSYAKNIIYKFIKPKEEIAIFEQIFESVRNKDFEQVCSNIEKIKNQNIKLEKVKKFDVPFGVFIAWMFIFDNQNEVFAEKTIRFIKEKHPDILKVKDSYDNSGEDWLKQIQKTINKQKYKI